MALATPFFFFETETFQTKTFHPRPALEGGPYKTGAGPPEGERYAVTFSFGSLPPCKETDGVLTLDQPPYISLAVGNPDVFHLVGMFEVPAAFALRIGEEIDVAAFVRPDLLQVAG